METAAKQSLYDLAYQKAMEIIDQEWLAAGVSREELQQSKQLADNIDKLVVSGLHPTRQLDEDLLPSLYPLVSLSSWLEPNGHIFVVGRSNIRWAELIECTWKYKVPENLEQERFTFVMVRPDADMSILSREEELQLRADLARSEPIFHQFRKTNPGTVNVRFSRWLPLDSMVFYEPLKGGSHLLQLDLSFPQENYDAATKERKVLEITSENPVYPVYRAKAQALYDRAGN
jgi:hypothetical protein